MGHTVVRLQSSEHKTKQVLTERGRFFRLYSLTANVLRTQDSVLSSRPSQNGEPKSLAALDTSFRAMLCLTRIRKQS